MKLRYYEVIKNGVSICLDYDINYYHHFKVGEIFCITHYFDYGNPKLVWIMDNKEKWEIGYRISFETDWDKTYSEELTVAECEFHKYFLDVSACFELKEIRDLKLVELGI